MLAANCRHTKRSGVSGASDIRTDIQALRGFAFLAVVLYYAEFGIFGAGYLGVDISFDGYLCRDGKCLTTIDGMQLYLSEGLTRRASLERAKPCPWRQVIERRGGFDVSFRIAAEDDANLRYFGRGGIRTAYAPCVLVKMRVGGESNWSFARIVRI